MANISPQTAKKIAHITGLAVGVVLAMAGNAAPTIEEAKRTIELGNDLGSSLVERIQKEARFDRYRR
ncbi:MAG TPA: hypothetical protein PLR76_02240 [Hyphomonas sp.]|nr:hypothetical protein [Hyphomonas sp.]